MYQIESITLHDGATVRPGNLTLFIGPNNGGKSQTLKDLVSIMTGRARSLKAVRGLRARFPHGYLAIVDAIAGHARSDESGSLILDTVHPDMTTVQPLRVIPGNIEARDHDQDTLQQKLHENLGRHLVSYLGTESRLHLVKKQTNRQINIEGHQTLIEAVFSSSTNTQKDINERVFTAFGTKLIIDKTAFAVAEFRLGDPENFPLEIPGYADQIRNREALDDQGDGIRAFCGIVVALETLKRPVVMIDEPETFLHPPQAFLIGQALADLQSAERQVFISTHSADVLRGILSITSDVTIVRLSRCQGGFISRIINPENLRNISRDPILSSARVLEGLFYSGVIITESDGDIVVYRKILEKNDPTASVNFTNSYSKQLSGKIAVPFQALEVPHAVIVDFDILRVEVEFKKLFEELGGSWAHIESDYTKLKADIEGTDNAGERLKQATSLLRAVEPGLAGLPDDEQRVIWLRRRLREVRDAALVWGTLKKTGETGLSAAGKVLYGAVSAAAAAVGLFIVPCGERESWLGPLVPYTKNKGKWTEDALTYLSQNRLPSEHALLAFMRQVQTHCQR